MTRSSRLDAQASSRCGVRTKKTAFKRFPELREELARLDYVPTRLLSWLRKVAGLSCPQYRGAEIPCQGNVSSPLFPSKIRLTCGTLVKFKKTVKCPEISGKMAGATLTLGRVG